MSCREVRYQFCSLFYYYIETFYANIITLQVYCVLFIVVLILFCHGRFPSPSFILTNICCFDKREVDVVTPRIYGCWMYNLIIKDPLEFNFFQEV